MDTTLPSTPEPPSGRGPRTGSEIAGRYRLGKLLGKGGRGEVYAALQIDLDREVAVKLLAEADTDEDTRARFLRETRIAADLRHPCIVQIFDAGVDADGAPYCVMELLEGETLADRIEREGPFEPAEAVALVESLCLALQAVHDKGFLHRDVKPSNVFLARRPGGGADPKLIDFGIAKRVALNPTTERRVTTLRGLGGLKATALNVIVGTPRYLSPEQILGTNLDARSDVHALAATLYEMIAGVPPFSSEELADLLAKIAVERPQPIARRAPESAVPAALDRAILRALAKDPAQRPATAADFARELRSALESDDDGAVPSSVPSSARRHIALALAAGIVVVAAAFALAATGRGPSGDVAQATTIPSPSAPPSPAPPPSVAPSLDSAPPASSSLPDEPPPRTTPPSAPRHAGRRGTDLKTPY